MIVVRVRQLAGLGWIVDIGVYGRRYDVAIGHLDRHAVLAPGIGAISGHLTVHCPVVGFRFFGIGPDFAWVVGDPEVARSLGWAGSCPIPQSARTMCSSLLYSVFAKEMNERKTARSKGAVVRGVIMLFYE
jgi:hypothetical protein